MNTMTKGERDDLAKLIRQRERLMKTGASQRAAELLADFERQLGTIYSYDHDQTWKAAAVAAKQAVAAAQADQFGEVISTTLWIESPKWH